MTKHITLYFLLLIGCLFNQDALAQLNTGDIAFVAFRFDGIDGEGNCNDGFSFIALADIPANTTIYFTEDESNGRNFIKGEGSISWVSEEAVPAKTVINIVTHVQSPADYCGGTNPTPTADIGTVQFVGTTGNWTLSTTAEEIYAYLGAVQAPTTWLAALWTDNADNSNTLPPALESHVLDFTRVDQDTDLGIYTGSTDCGDAASCLAEILNTDNWTTENETESDCCDDNGVNHPEDIPTFIPENTAFESFLEEGDCILHTNGSLVGQIFRTGVHNLKLNKIYTKFNYNATCGYSIGSWGWVDVFKVDSSSGRLIELVAQSLSNRTVHHPDYHDATGYLFSSRPELEANSTYAFFFVPGGNVKSYISGKRTPNANGFSISEFNPQDVAPATPGVQTDIEYFPQDFNVWFIIEYLEE